MSLSLKEIPGLAELLASTAEIESATREDAWICGTHHVAGFPVRTMTVDDYVVLLQFNSPLIQRILPSPEELAFFLWAMSPEVERWHCSGGWRNWKCSRWLERLQGWRHGKRVRKQLHLAELEQQEREWHAKSSVPFTMPDDSPFVQSCKQAFEYIDVMFLDSPPRMKRDGTKSGLCFLTSWFDLIQSEYHLPTDEVWRMKLPVLFARIKAIQMRKYSSIPDFNVERDKIFQNLMRGLKAKLYTEQDLKDGKVDLRKNRLN